MNDIFSLSQDNLTAMSRQYFMAAPTVLYGAGGNGCRLWHVLREQNVPVRYFCDDDFNKWGTTVDGLPVISFAELEALAASLESVAQEPGKAVVNVILTSVFSGPIVRKLTHVKDRFRIFEPFAILMNVFYPHSFYQQPLAEEARREILTKIDALSDAFSDEESRRILTVIKETIAGDGKPTYRPFLEIASEEDCYFVGEVLAALPPHPVIADCGGFTGDIMVALAAHGIDYEKVYSFEPNGRLLAIMERNIKENQLEQRFIPVAKGVWDTSGKAYLNFDETDIAGGNIGCEPMGTEVETVALDSFFAAQRVDFLKMDIEGAELPALRGGLRMIERDRPILAISLYHSPHDVVDIPQYLMNHLAAYRFFIRHHSFIGTETVLYGIPQEGGYSHGRTARAAVCGPRA